MPLRVAINLASATDRFRGGTGTFVDGLLDGLSRRDDLEVVVVASPAAAALGVWERPAASWTQEIVVDPAAASFGFAALGDPAVVADLVRRRGIDVWFTPHTLPAPPVLPCPTVGAILDVQHEDLPELYAPRERARRALVYETIARTSTRIVTLSDFSRARIAARYAVDPDRIDVVPLGPPAWTRLPRDAAPVPVPGAAAPAPPYVLYPATTWRHKNHVTLLDALARVRARGAPLDLVLTGLEGDGHSEVMARVADHGLSAHVRWLGYVDDDRLRGLYDAATVVAVPSRYEGFGLPLLEAMARGVPIVASTAASLPEVAGDAALLVPPLDAGAWADALFLAATDVGLAGRLRAAGRARVAGYGFDETARRVGETCARAVREGPVSVAEPRHVGPARDFRGCCRYYVQAPAPGALVVAGEAAWRADWRMSLETTTPGRRAATELRTCEGQGVDATFTVAEAPASLCLTAVVGREGASELAHLTRLSLRLGDGADLDLLPAVHPGEHEETLEEGLARAVMQLRGLADRGIRRLALYGAGSHSAQLIGRLARESATTVVGVIDDQPGASTFAGVARVTPDAWHTLDADAVVLSSRASERLLAARAVRWLPAVVPLVRLYSEQDLS